MEQVDKQRWLWLWRALYHFCCLIEKASEALWIASILRFFHF